MSTRTHCDGCGKELQLDSLDHAIHGERANDMRGGGLPDDDFDWCKGCATLAFAAVEDAVKGRQVTAAGYTGRGI